MTDQATVERIVEFHGHMCPGLAMGIRAAEIALDQVGAHAADEEVVAIVETDMCGVDAIQFLTGCTFGKGNLIHLDHGKNAYTFCRRSDGHSIRVRTKPEGWGPPEPEWEGLFAAVRAGTATPDEKQRFLTLHRARAERILAAPAEELYDVAEVNAEIPPRARIHTSIPCADCAEPTMETRVRLHGGRMLCPPCFDAEIAGRSPVPAPTAMRR
jgi:formylmethanofuran dehydrogenase subunit E